MNTTFRATGGCPRQRPHQGWVRTGVTAGRPRARTELLGTQRKCCPMAHLTDRSRWQDPAACSCFRRLPSRGGAEAGTPWSWLLTASAPGSVLMALVAPTQPFCHLTECPYGHSGILTTLAKQTLTCQT